MTPFKSNINFPSQRVGKEEKDKASWYANCIDFIIEAGVALNDKDELNKKINILHGNVPNEFYAKTINPYNASKEKFTRFPATMRNLDIMSDIIRRYVSEYLKGIHDFVVGSNSPDIIINKTAKLKEAVSLLAQETFAKQFEQKFNEAISQGVPKEQINPSELMPNIDDFIKTFNQNYIDEASTKGQELLEFIQDMTNDELIYIKAYFDFVSFGECYTYSEVRGNKLHKECVPVIEAYPICNSEFFVDSHDMFARCMKMTYQQMLDMFDKEFTDKDRNFLKSFYAKESSVNGVTRLSYTQLFENYPDICNKFNNKETKLFKDKAVTIYDGNSDLYDVWHVTWRGEAKVGILTYTSPIGIISKMQVDEDFVFDETLGHIDIEWIYIPQVYEGYRIGSRTGAIYPIKARPIAYSRNGKLPYNGIMELLPQFGSFSIIETITPFQVLRNIISYHREMVIAKNKMLILIMPQSLLGNEEEDVIYKMAADGVLYYDDSNDSNSLKAQQIRLINANLGNYISELTGLIENIKQEARELVDMTPQRYGQIANSAGKGTTQEAITRGSMGSVIVTFMFDEFRKRDYDRDLDYCKFAFIDGLQTGYFDKEKQHRYLSLDINTLSNYDLSTTVRNSVKELDKIEQLKDWAFNAGQNGDLDMALAAISGNNFSSMKKSINDFMEIKRKHEASLKEAETVLEQEKLNSKIQEIMAKGEEDRKTEQLKYYYELQAKYVDVDLSILNNDSSTEDSKNLATKSIESSKREIDKLKLNIEAQKIQADMYNKAADRNVKREDIKTKLKIATTNKNQYDKK